MIDVKQKAAGMLAERDIGRAPRAALRVCGRKEGGSMRPLNRQRGLWGWVVSIAVVCATGGIGVAQDSPPSGSQDQEQAAEKPQSAPTSQPTSQPTTRPAVKTGSQPATDAVDKYRELQERARRLTDEEEPHEIVRQQAKSRPSREPSRLEDARERRAELLRQRKQRAAERAKEGLQREPPRTVRSQDRGRTVQPSSRRGRSVRPGEGLDEERSAALSQQAPDDRVSVLPDQPTTAGAKSGPEVAAPRKAEEERSEWFQFVGMAWEDVIIHFAERVGKPLMSDSLDMPVGELTYVSSRTFTQQEAIDELQFLLYKQGYYFLETEHYVYVVGLSDVEHQLPLEFIYATLAEFERANPRDMQFVIVYIDMGKEEDAQRVVDAFTPFFEMGPTIPVVAKDTNKVKLVALAVDVRKFLELHARLDLEKQDIRQTKVYKFKTSVREIERILRDQLSLAARTTRYDRGQRRVVTETPEGDIRITADERTNTLIIRAKPEDFAKIDRFFEETKIDEIGEIGDFITTVIEIQHGNATEIATLLNQIFQQEQGQQAPRVRVTPRTPQRRTSSRGRTQSRTRQRQPQQPTPQDIIVEDIYERAKKTVRIFPDDRTNTIIVYANKEGLGRVREMLAVIDQPVPSKFRTFKLEHAKAEQIQPIVEQIARGTTTTASRGRTTASVIVDAPNNALHIFAEREAMTRIEAIIKELDVEGAKENRHVVELENLAPSRVAQMILPMLGGSGRSMGGRSGRRGGQVRMSATPQVIPLDEAGVLIVYCSDEDWAKIEETIKLWDGNAVSNTPELKVFKIEHGNPQSIFSTLMLLYRTYTHPTLGRSQVLIANEGETVYVQAIKPALEEIEALIASMDVESAGKPLVILPLAHADATQVAQQVRPLLTQGGGGRYSRSSATGPSVQAEPVTNSLIIRADKATLEQIKTFAKEMDEKVAAQIPEQKFYTLRYAQPREVATAIQTMFGSGGRSGRRGGPVGTQVKAVVSGQQVIVEAPQDKMVEIAAFIAQLDDPSGLEIVIKTVKLPGAEVNTISSRLTAAFRVKSQKQGIVARFDADPASETILVTCSKMVEEEVDTLLKEYEAASKGIANKVEFRKLKHATASEAATWLREQLIAATQTQLGRNASRQVKVTADTRTNRIIINAPSVAVEMGMSLLENYDVPTDEPPVNPVEVRKYKLAGLDVNNLARVLTITYRNRPVRPDKLKVVFTADVLTENLIVSGPTDEFDRIEKFVKEFEAETADLEPIQKFIQIEHADANYIASQVRALLNLQISRKRGRDVANRINIMPEPRLNRVVINAPKFALEMAEALIAELDQVSTAVGLIKTIALENADANTVRGILQSVLRERMRTNRTLSISVEPMTNSLIVSADNEDFAEIEKWAKELDEQAVTAKREPKIFELKNASVWEVIGVLNSTFLPRGSGRRQPVGKEISFAQVAGRSIIVQAPTEKLADIEKVIKQIDEIGAASVEVRIYELPGIGNQIHALASNVANAVNQKLSGKGARERRISITPYPTADTLIVTALPEQFPEIQEMMDKFEGLFASEKTVTKFIELKHLNAPSVAGMIQNMLANKLTREKRGSRATQNLQITADPRTNRLIAYLPEKIVRDLEEVIAQLDVPAKDDQGRIRTIALSYADAGTVANILNQFYMRSFNRRRGQDRSQIEVRIYPESITNSLLVQASDEDFETIEAKALEIDEGSIVRRTEPEIIKLEYADPWQIVNVINNAFSETGRGRGRVRNEQRDVNVQVVGASLLLQAPKEKLEDVKALIAKLDVADVGGVVLKTFVLPGMGWELNNLASNIQRTLQQMQPRAGRSQQRPTVWAYPQADTLIASVPADMMEDVEKLIEELTASTGDTTPKTEFFELEFARANEIAGTLNQLVSTRVTRTRSRQAAAQISIVPDQRTNRIIVTAPEKLMREVELVLQSLDVEPVEMEGQLHTLSLVNADASAVSNILRPIYQRKASNRRRDASYIPATIQPETITNTLIVSCGPEDYEEIKQWVEEFDAKVVMRRTKPTIIELKNANPWELIGILNTAFVPRGGRRQPMGKEISFSVIAGRSIVVQAPPEKMPAIQELIADLDQIGTVQVEVRVYELPGIGNRINDLATQVRNNMNVKIGSRGGREQRVTVTTYPPADAIIVTALPEQFEEVEAMMETFKGLVETTKVEMEFLELEYVNAAQIAGMITNFVRAKVQRERGRRSIENFSVTADPRTNQLIVMAPEAVLPDVREIVSKLDVPERTKEGHLRVIALVDADANQIVSTLRPIYDQKNRTKRNDQSYIPVSITPETLTNSLLVIAGDSEFEEIEAEVARIDSEMADIDVTPVLVELKYLDPNQVRGMVNEMFGGGRRRGPRGSSVTQDVLVSVAGNGVVLKGPPKKVEEIKNLIAKVDSEGQGLEIKVYSLEVLDAQETARGVQMALVSMGTRARPGQMKPGAFAEPTTNTLIVMADKAQMPFVDTLITKLESQTGKVSEPRIYKLEFARADQIAPNVEAMLQAKAAERQRGGGRRQQQMQTTVVADQRTNRLVVYAPDEYQELAAELVRMIDEDVDTGKIVHIIPLEQADATLLAQTLNQAVQEGYGGGGRRRGGRYGGGGGGTGQVRITADAGSNSILISGLPRDVEEVEELIERLEINSEQVPELQIFQLEYATTMDVTDALNGAFAGGGGRGGRPADRVTITEDDYYNRLIVTANKRLMRQVEAYIKQLDAAPTDVEPGTLPGGKKLYFVDIYRGDPYDIAYDVQNMLPDVPNGPTIEASWFGEYITVTCRPTEYQAIEDLIRQFESRVKLEMVISTIKPKGNLDEVLEYIQQLQGLPVQIEGPTVRPRRVSIVEELWEEDEEPPNYKRNGTQNRQVGDGVSPYLIAPALLPVWLQDAYNEFAQAQETPEDQPRAASADGEAQESPEPARTEPAPDDQARPGADAQEPPLRRDPVRVQVLPDGRIVLRGPRKQVDEIEDALDVMTGDMGLGEVIRIFHFKYGDVNSAAQILDRMFNERRVVVRQPQQQQRGRQGQQGQQGQQGRGQQQQGLMGQLQNIVGGRQQSSRGGTQVRYATDPGHNYLIVKCDEELLPEVRQLLRELDIPPGEVNIKVIQLKNLEANETAQNIKDILGITKAQSRRNPFAGARRRGGNQQQQLMQMLQQQMVSISGTEGGGAKVEMVEIVPNQVTNSLMVSAPPEVMGIIVGVIDELEQLEGGSHVVIKHRPLNIAKVDDVQPLLEQIFAGTAGGGRGPRGRSPGELGPVTISGDPRVNTIIYTCEAKDVETVEAQITALDIVGAISDAETYVCQWGDADVIAGVVEAIYGQPTQRGGSPRRGGASSRTEVRIVSEPTTNTIVVWGPLDKRAEIMDQIAVLDERSQRSFQEIPVIYADAEELADKLMQMFGGQAGGGGRRRGPSRSGPAAGGRVVILGDDNAKKLLVRAPEKLFPEIVELVQMLDQPNEGLQVKRFDLVHARAEIVVEQVKTGLMEYMQMRRGKGKDINFDAFTAMAEPRTNSVVVVGSEETFLFVQTLLAQVDLPTPLDKQRVFRIFTLDKADAQTVADAINSLSATGGGSMGGSRGGRRGGRSGGGATAGGGELNVMASSEAATNSVMVYGTAEDILVVEESIIKPFEAISLEGQPTFVKLKYARAENVALTLDEFFRNRGGARGGRGGQRLADEVSFAADSDTNTLIYVASGTNREFVKSLIDELDTEEGGREIRVFQLMFADANSAAQVLTTTFEESRRGGRGGRGGAVGQADQVIATPDVPSNTIIVRANAANMTKVAELINELEDTIAVSFDPVEIEIHNAQASQVASFIWQFLGDTAAQGGSGRRGGQQGVRRGPQIIPNDNANTLIVRGSKAEVERIQMLAQRFDDPEIVASKVKIIEVPLGHDAITLGPEVERIVNDAEELDAEQTGRRPRLVVIGADDYTNTLIVGGNAAQFGTVETIVQQLASVRPDGQVTRILEFKNLSSDSAVEVINYLQEQRGGGSRSGGIRRSTPSRRRSSGGGGTRGGRRRQRAMLWSPLQRSLSAGGQVVPAAYGEPFVGTLIVMPMLAEALVAQSVDEPQDPKQEQEKEEARPQRRRPRQNPDAAQRGQRGRRQQEQPADQRRQRAADQRRGQDAPRQRSQRQAQQQQEPVTIPGLAGLSGALRGDVTATPLDSRRIVITGDARDVDFLEKLLLQMERDAPVFEIEVFTLLSAKATALQPILTETIDSMIRGRVRSPGPADQFSINAEARSNSLIVSAAKENLEMIAELIKALDFDAKEGIQFKLIPLKYMRAVEAVAQLNPVIEKLIRMKDLPQNAQPSIEANDRSNAILIVGTPKDIEEIESLITAVDVEISPDEDRFGALSEMVIVGLKNARAEDIAEVLTNLIEAEQERARQAAGASQPGEPVVRKLRLTSVEGEVLAEIDLEKPIRLIPEKGTNSLIIFSTPENNASMQELVRIFDTLPVGEDIDVKSFALQYGNAEQVAELLATMFEESKKALVRPVDGDASKIPADTLPPVPPGLAGQGLPYNVAVVHDVRSNTVFVIGRKDAVLLAAGLITELDRPSTEIASQQPYVLTFRNLQASDLEEKLNDMLDKRLEALGDKANQARDSAIITPFDRSNSLVVFATEDIYEMLEELTRQLDDAEMYRIVGTEYRHLEYADAMKLQAMLQEVFDRKRDAEGQTKAESKDILFVTADPRSNSLMITGTRDYLAEAEELIEELDRQFDPTVELKVRKVRLNSAANIATKLQEMIDKSLNQGDSKLTGTPMYISADPLSESLLLAASHEDMVLLERWVELLDLPPELEAMRRIVPLARANAEDLAKTVQDLFQDKAGEDVGNLTVTFDPTTNSVVAIGPPALVNDVESFIRDLDQTTPVNGAVLKMFKLEQADAEDAGELLRSILEGRGGSVGSGTRSGSRQDAVERIMLVYQQERPGLAVETLRAMTQDIVVIDDLRTNSLVITAPPESMPLMESIVVAIDVPPDAAKIRVFQLLNGDAEEMVTMLEELFEESQQSGTRSGGGDEQERILVIGEGLAEGGRQNLTFTTDVRTNSVIAAGTTGYLDLVEELIISLDSVELEERKTFVYAPRNVPADVLATSIREFSDQEQQRLQDLGEEISTLRRMEREIGAIANEDSNRVIFSVHPRMESEVLSIVSELDQPPPQVMIQVLILEVTTENNLELGIEFAFQDLQYTKAGVQDTTTFDFVGGTDIGAAGTGLGGFTFTVTGRDFNFLMRALQSESSLRILSRPQIVAMDNQEASIDIVTRVPVVTSSTTTTSGQLQVATNYEDAGIKLTVTPQINPDGFVRMEIEQEVSDFTGSTVNVGGGVNLPVLFERNANTTVTVKDNETVVLGGLITSKEDSQEQKIPILGDLPGLGLLFRNQVNSVTRTELLIVLTPRVLRTIEDYYDASVEVRDETGTLPYEVLTNPLMKGLRIEPKDLRPLSDEELLGPFPSELIEPEAEPESAEDTYGPPAPRQRKETGTQVNPNSYDVPITRRFR